MPEFSEIFVIFNPASTGNSEALARDFAENVGEVATVSLRPTQHAGHAETLAFDIAKSHARPLIVSSSGDGGYNEVINGALRAQVAGASPVCAVLAAGNANDHSRSVVHRPLEELVVRGSVTPIDVLKATITSNKKERSRYAHSYMGLGLTPTVAVELNKTDLNRFKETLIVFKALRDLEPVTISVDGRRKLVDSLVVANVENMAKMLTIARGAQPDDGSFTITTFPYRKRAWLIPTLLKAALFGVEGVHATHFTFEVERATVMQFDGEVEELGAGDTVAITIEPKLLSTLR